MTISDVALVAVVRVPFSVVVALRFLDCFGPFASSGCSSDAESSPISFKLLSVSSFEEFSL